MSLKRKIKKNLKKISISDINATPFEFKSVAIHEQFRDCFNEAAIKSVLDKKAYGGIYQWNEPVNGKEYYLYTPHLGQILRKLKLKEADCFLEGLYVRKIAPSRSFVFYTKKESKIALAVEKLIEMTNAISEKGFVKASLSPLFICNAKDGYFIGSYLVLEDQDFNLVQDLYKGYYCVEGSKPTEIK